MSVKVEIDEEATGFQILEEHNGEPCCVSVDYTPSYGPDIQITLSISREMIRDIFFDPTVLEFLTSELRRAEVEDANE